MQEADGKDPQVDIGGTVVEKDQVVLVKIRKLNGKYGVTIDTGEGVVLEEEYYQPESSEEVGRLIQMWLDGLEP